MGRFQNSIALAKSSWQVLRDDKQLTLLPLLSLLVDARPRGRGPACRSASSPATGPATTSVPSRSCGCSASSAASRSPTSSSSSTPRSCSRRTAASRVEPVTVGDAIHAASARSHVLLPWAIVSATVSIVLRAIEQRGGIIGRIVGSIAGVAWSVVTFLVLPVLVFEGIGPIAAVKRSGELFKHTWGENLMTNAGIGHRRVHRVSSSARSRSCCSSRSAARSRSSGSRCSCSGASAVFLVTSTLTGIFQVALYRFATGAPVPGLRARASCRDRSAPAVGSGRGLFGGGNTGGFRPPDRLPSAQRTDAARAVGRAHQPRDGLESGARSGSGRSRASRSRPPTRPGRARRRNRRIRRR